MDAVRVGLDVVQELGRSRCLKIVLPSRCQLAGGMQFFHHGKRGALDRIGRRRAGDVLQPIAHVAVPLAVNRSLECPVTERGVFIFDAARSRLPD